MDTLSLYPFTSFSESSWEARAPPVFSLDVVYKIVFKILGNLNLSMAYMDCFPKAAPGPTHDGAVVTSPTL